MKTIEEMAQKYSEIMLEKEDIDFDKLGDMAKYCFELAEAMQAEAEKRKTTPNADPMRKVREAEWQPDWSQAPEWANWWALDIDNMEAHWFETKPTIDVITWSRTTRACKVAPNFYYYGDWKDSLRKRP